MPGSVPTVGEEAGRAAGDHTGAWNHSQSFVEFTLPIAGLWVEDMVIHTCSLLPRS